MRSGMRAQHDFSRIPRAEIPRSSFNRSHRYKTTFDGGYLIPVYVDLAYPGDTFNLRMTAFGRLATPEFPFMDDLFLDSQFWAVPIRLIWNNFQKMMGEQVDPGDSTDYLMPVVSSTDYSGATGFPVGSLYDYFGIRTGVDGLTINNIFARAYNLIYNEWYRDQNLQDSIPVDKDDGPDDPNDYVPRRRGVRHDYFASCLPWPQKGDAITLPLGSSADVWGSASASDLTSDVLNKAPWMGWYQDRATTDGTTKAVLSAQVPNGTSTVSPSVPGTSGLGWNRAVATGTGTTNVNNEDVVFLDKTSSQAIRANAVAPFTADLSTATATTINEIREAFQLQRLLERDARGGTRYTEIIRSHFGVVSPDARLQRPEYLGGGSSRINVHPVAQTSETDAGTPQGNLAAFATVSAKGHGYIKSFTEHTIVLGLVSVRADLSYQQGVPRIFSDRTRYDMYWPVLSHLGEQAVLNKEIFAQGTADDLLPFGYQEKDAHLRYFPSKITGQFRSDAPSSLDAWHLARDFASLPLLNSTFIQDTPPIERVVAVTSEPEFLFDAYFDYKCARPMPTYGVPGFIDHF